MTYTRKTRDTWIIQQWWDSEYGWEDICEEETRKDARQTVKEYRENQPEAPVRFILRRVKIEEA